MSFSVKKKSAENVCASGLVFAASIAVVIPTLQRWSCSLFLVCFLPREIKSYVLAEQNNANFEFDFFGRYFFNQTSAKNLLLVAMLEKCFHGRGSILDSFFHCQINRSVSLQNQFHLLFFILAFDFNFFKKLLLVVQLCLFTAAACYNFSSSSLHACCMCLLIEMSFIVNVCSFVKRIIM